MTKARDIATLLSTANGKIAGNNLDVSFENITDTGTEGTRVATGTQAQRGTTQGQLRFNTDTGLAEYYTGTAFKTIDAPPTVSSIDVTEIDSQAGGNQTFVITGSGFASGATVTFVGASGTNFNASTVTVDSDTQITAVASKASFLNAQEPYGVKVENTSGLSNTLAGQINVDTSPSWSTASGSLGSVEEGASASFSVSATDPDGDTVAYSETGGTVLSTNGLSINSSTGAITGTAGTVSADTTLNFDLRATANSKTADRAFSIIILNNPLQGVSEFSSLNLEDSSNFLSTLNASGNIYEVTTSSVIDTVAGTNWTGTKLLKLDDGGNCGNWSNLVSAIGSSGGWTVTHWGRLDASSGTSLSGTINNPYARHLDFYSRQSDWLDWNNPSNTSSIYFGSAGFSNLSTNSLIGQSTLDMKEWRFFSFSWSVSPVSSSSQTFKISISHNGSMYHVTSGSFTVGSSSSEAGFMGYNPVGGTGINQYNWEGWTGGWRAFNTALSDAQINYLYNSGAGRF